MGKPLTQAREIIKNDLSDAIDAIADLNQTISGTYTDTEVQAISDKVDAILAALRTLGILASS